MKKSLKYMNIQNVPYSYSPIRKVAKFLGNLVASFEAVTYGRLFYRFIEIDKINALKLSKGKFALYLHLCTITKIFKTPLKNDSAPTEG